MHLQEIYSHYIISKFKQVKYPDHRKQIHICTCAQSNIIDMNIFLMNDDIQEYIKLYPVYNLNTKLSVLYFIKMLNVDDTKHVKLIINIGTKI